MTVDHIAAAATLLVLVVGAGVYHQKVVKPADEARYAVLACMADKGDLRGPESRRHFDECVEDLNLR